MSSRGWRKQRIDVATVSWHELEWSHVTGIVVAMWAGVESRLSVELCGFDQIRELNVVDWSLMSRLDVGADASGFLVPTRCRRKSPAPLAMQTQEPKMKVAPSSIATVVKLNDAIEFARESSMNTAT
jgi:hypothetical protein